jgi:EXS family
MRIRQCWVQLVGASDNWARLPITLNLIKYATAFPPIWLAAAASLGYFHPDLPAITAAMATLNSLYSYSVRDVQRVNVACSM